MSRRWAAEWTFWVAAGSAALGIAAFWFAYNRLGMPLDFPTVSAALGVFGTFVGVLSLIKAAQAEWAAERAEQAASDAKQAIDKAKAEMAARLARFDFVSELEQAIATTEGAMKTMVHDHWSAIYISVTQVLKELEAVRHTHRLDVANSVDDDEFDLIANELRETVASILGRVKSAQATRPAVSTVQRLLARTLGQLQKVLAKVKSEFRSKL